MGGNDLNSRGIFRDMFIYGGVRWLLWLIVHNVWPNYSMLILDAAACIGSVLLYEPGQRNWRRMVFAAVFVELLRYLPHRSW